MSGLFGDYNEGGLLFLGDWGPAAVAALVLLGALVVGLSWYDLRDMTRARRWSLIALRASVYGLAVLMLLEPALELRNVTKVKNRVAVLVDTSRSQTLRVEDDSTRLDRVREALGKDAARKLLTEPNEDHAFDVYTFDEGLRPSTWAEVVHPGLKAEGDATRTLEAIEEVVRKVGRRDLGGVVILSDGIDSGLLGGRVRPGEALDQETRTFLERLGAPVHTVGTATREGLKDLSIKRVLYDDFAFVRNKISVDVVLHVIGFEPETIPVTLRREGRVLQTREVEIGPDATEYKVSFELVPQQIGREIYTVTVPTWSGEALLENNRKDFVLKVIRDKIRALQVVGQPSWDERFLRQLLKRNPNVDLISFFILRTNENAQVVPNNELSLIPFPTQELFEQELGSFDIVFFQNFNYQPYQMTQYLPRVAEYVRNGGGFVMLGGELSMGSGGYQGTAIADILPVVLPPIGPREALVRESPFVMKLTEAGERHPITQLAFEPAVNRERWEGLPALEGLNVTLGARPEATVLGVHPSLEAEGKPMPAVAVWEVGKGRSMAVTTDATWMWSFHSVGEGGTSRPYHTFWNSAIRWLIKDPDLKLLRIEIDEAVARPGQDVPIQVRLVKPDYTPAPGVEGSLEVLYRPLEALSGDEAEGDPRALEAVKFVTDERGRAEVVLPATETGAYEVIAKARTEGGELVDRDIFLVSLDSQELRAIEPREELLKAVAEAGQGTFQLLPDFDPDLTFKEPRVVQVNSRKLIDLWDTLYVLAIICGLLGTEWTLRRRWGRL